MYMCIDNLWKSRYNIVKTDYVKIFLQFLTDIVIREKKNE